jgi:nitrous oxidase accessory protein
VENEIQVQFVAAYDQEWSGNFWSDYVGWDVDGNGVGDVPYRSNTLVDDLLARYPLAKLLLASPALQVLAVAERQFPVITVPKGVDASPRMSPPRDDWVALLDRYPARAQAYYGSLEKLPHLPGEG